MLTNHAVVWLDHVEAHVIHFTMDESQLDVVKTRSMHPHLHIKAGQVGVGRAPESAKYFDAIAKVVDDSKEILLLGPGSEKSEFMKYIETHHPALSTMIGGALAADHPTDPQLLAFARKYFVKMDRTTMDPVEALKHDD